MNHNFKLKLNMNLEVLN